jgi:hypothetical protein
MARRAKNGLNLALPPGYICVTHPEPRCAEPLHHAPGEAVAFTLDDVPAFALGRYEGALRRAIMAMKSGRRDPLDAFAALLAERALLDGALIPLPTTLSRILDRGFDRPVRLGRRGDRESGARITGPTVIGDGVRVGAKATLDRAIVWNGSTIGVGASVRDTAVGERHVVEGGTALDDAIVANEPSPA